MIIKLLLFLFGTGTLLFIIGMCTMPSGADTSVSQPNSITPSQDIEKSDRIHSTGFLIAMIGIGIVVFSSILGCTAYFYQFKLSAEVAPGDIRMVRFADTNTVV